MHVRRASYTVISCVVAVSATAVAVPIPPNVPVSGALPNLQNEEQVWICPNDTNVVYANHRDFRLGYRQIGMGRSTDGGATWTDTLMSPAVQLYNWQSDPVLTVTSSGRMVHCDLDFRSTTPNYDSSFMAFLVSDDCGQTWMGPYTTLPDQGNWFEDKQFITSDRTGGIHDGNVYVSWTRFSDFDPTRIMFCRSTVGGTIWDDTVIAGAPLNVTCAGGVVSAGQFSQPVVGKDGAVYVFWQGYDVDSSAGCSFYDAIRFVKSMDAGNTWSTQRVIQRVSGWSIVDGNIDVYSQPTTDCDISSGPHTGNLYLQYRDTVPSFNDSDIMFRRSLDTGHTWSPPIRVNDDPTGFDVDQFHNWMVCNQDGHLVSIWYDQRMDPNHTKFDVFAAYSYDGGATWTSNHRVSSVSSDPGALAQATSTPPMKKPTGVMGPQTPMAGRIGEYICVSAVHDKVVAVWTDTRANSQDVWSARWYLPLTDPRLLTATDASLACGDSLHWATAWKESEDLYRVQISATNAFNPGDLVYDELVTTSGIEIPVGLASGSYFWRIKSYRAPGGTPADSTAFSASRTFAYVGCCQCNCHADPAGCNAVQDITDVVQTINVAFRGAAAIFDPNANCPYQTTDTNCSNSTDVIDVVKMVNVAFRGANVATEFCDPCP